MTQLGIVLKAAVTGVRNDKTMSIKAATKIVLTEAFFVIATQPTDSPYVVFGQIPKTVPTMEPTPSPSKVLDKPGSVMRSLLMMELKFLWSAMCSANVTNATGTKAKATSATPTGVMTCATLPFWVAAATMSALTAPSLNSLIPPSKANLGYVKNDSNVMFWKFSMIGE